MIADSLTAIKPDRLRVIDRHCKAIAARCGCCGVEPREEAICEGMTRVCEGRLGNRVIFRKEIKLDLSTNLNDQVIRAVLKESVFADIYLDRGSRLSGDSGDRDGGETKEGIGGLHCDLDLLSDDEKRN